MQIAAGLSGMAMGMVAMLFLTMPVLQRSPTAQTLPELELHLVLAFDVSASVNDVEFVRQRRGTAAALRAPSVMRAIRNAPGGVAMSVVQWSSIRRQASGLGWAWIQTDEETVAFARAVDAMPRRLEGGGTMIHAGLSYAAEQFDTAPHVARRQVIDLSGNGQTDDAIKLREVRDSLLRRGIVINALAIEEDTDDLTDYFHAEVIGGRQSFVITADDWNDFSRAMQIKLLREIRGAVFSSIPTVTQRASR
ncbi:DUF1194 domain-containing protein [Pseudohalocynthiibacter aestuariivivens]|nr:DUF1194 domain-containing protein [Pseudohalocynthiibacter aestuariivivens]QIE46866.1 DUF1194 domain-containing protein [Pseudohalocynthiibacter aestuariivivens]